MDNNFPISDEYIEAHNATLKKQRQQYKKNLSETNAKLFSECETLAAKLIKANIPFSFWINPAYDKTPRSFYTFSHFLSSKFKEMLSKECQENAWDVLTSLFPAILGSFANLYQTKIIAYSLLSNEVIFDTHTNIKNDEINLMYNENDGDDEETK